MSVFGVQIPNLRRCLDVSGLFLKSLHFTNTMKKPNKDHLNKTNQAIQKLLRANTCWQDQVYTFFLIYICQPRTSPSMMVFHHSFRYQKDAAKFFEGDEPGNGTIAAMLAQKNVHDRLYSGGFGGFCSYKNDMKGIQVWMYQEFIVNKSGWWFQICFIFTPIWGRFPL